ncbi:DUF2203 domain-containing protein [Phycisphaeraceae bacterium D3-23]
MLNHPAQTKTLEPAADVKRTFCVDEANRALPYVSRVVADVVDLHDEVVHIRRTMERVELGLHGADAKALERDYRAAMERLRILVRELDVVGVDLQDFERGIVTFPTFHDGHDAALSWKLGEDEVRYWHDADSGFDARQPIAQLIQ